MTECHEQGADVGVSDAELAELAGRVTDRVGRVIGPAHEDFLGGEDHRHRSLEALDVEGVGVIEELEQVEAGQVASRVVQVHVLRARVRTIDAPGVVGGVPFVDGGVELHAGVGALPRGLGDLAHEVACRHGLDYRTVGDGTQVPGGVVYDGLHEVVGDANRVVGVLVLDRVAVLAVEIHVEPGVGQGPSLLLLTGLAPDELFDVGMVDVEDHHLGRTSSLATRLDGAGRGICSSHEADRSRRGATPLEQLHR